MKPAMEFEAMARQGNGSYGVVGKSGIGEGGL